MTLTVEDVKKLTADFQAAKQELQAKIQRAPDSPDLWDDDHEESSSLADLVRGLNTDTMPPAALAMQEQLIADLEVFTNTINAKISEVSIHNTRIQLEIEKLTKDFLAAIRVPESDLGAALFINKKIIDPVDYEALIVAYRELGFTNFEIKAQKDVVYYNPDIKHFNTLKDELFEALPKEFRKKYPTLLNFIQNGLVRTNPVYSHDLIQVMEARQV
jgi:hypothetical protein